MRTWIVTAVLLAAAAIGCSRAPSPSPTATDRRWVAAIVDQQQRADRLLDSGDPGGARAALEAVVETTRRGDAGEERRLVLQDTYFRLARLALGQRDPPGALAYADAGLALGLAPHIFVANLLVVKGAAREAMGDPRAAAEDYHRALTMNETLLHQALPTP